MNQKSSEQRPLQSQAKFYRFRVFVEAKGEHESEIRRNVGMAYLREGQHMFTVRLWTLQKERFYLIPSKENAAIFLVMTREPNMNSNSTSKYFWNIVGSGVADSKSGRVRIEFDLLNKPVFMNLFPEANSSSPNLMVPGLAEEAA